MADELQGVRVTFVVANEGIEQAELVEPWNALVTAGGDAALAAPKTATVQTFRHLDKADTREATVATTELDAAALVLPDVRKRTLTSWPSLRTDITNAGGRWPTKRSTSTGTSSAAARPPTCRRSAVRSSLASRRDRPPLRTRKSTRTKQD